VNRAGDRFTIKGGSRSGDGKNLFHSFREFGLDSNQIATFRSSPGIKNILSRINGGNPSVINGLLEVVGGNSNLFLINPAGVIFGKSASLNVPGSFTATTATKVGFGSGIFSAFGANDYRQLIGNPNSFQFDTNKPTAIVNAGNLAVSQGQNISLVAGNVINTGTIQAPGGSIQMQAVPGTSRVKISQEGQILSLEVNLPQENIPITLLDLPALLTGAPVQTGLTVTPKGDVIVNNGGLTIPYEPGVGLLSGSLNVVNPEGKGGKIAVLGDRLGVVNADLDASGTAGGGTILIGGDYQGKGTLPTASQTFVSANSFLKADGLGSPSNKLADGGQVVIWSDKSTQFLGNITAKGGQQGGDGGLIEVSGGSLWFNGMADASAPLGSPGTVLLDPKNITIGRFDDPNNIGDILNSKQGTNKGIGFDELEDQSVNIANTTITAIANTGSNVVLQANNDITVNQPIIVANPNGNGGTIDLLAGRSIIVNESIETDNGNLFLRANQPTANGVIDQYRDAGEAQITIANNAFLNAGSGNLLITLDTGEGLTNKASGDITIGAGLRGGLIGITNIGQNQGSITINPSDSTGKIEAQTSLILQGKSIQSTGNLNLSAGENITLRVDSIQTEGNLNLAIDNPANKIISEQDLTIVAKGNANISPTIVTSSAANTLIAHDLSIDAATINVVGDIDASAPQGAGNIQLTSTVGDITVKSLNTTSYGNDTPGNILVQSQGGFQTTGFNDFYKENFNIEAAILTEGSTTLDKGKVNIIAGSGVDVSSSSVRSGSDLVINAKTINTGEINTSQGAVELIGSENTTVGGTVEAASFTTGNQGITILNGGAITTTGNQNYNNPVTLGSNTNLQGATINFNASLDSPNQSNLTVGATNIKLSQTTDLGDINLNASGTTNLDNPLSANSLTTDGGVTNLNAGEIVTTGNQNYNNPVTLGSNANLQGATINFNASLHSPNQSNLTLGATNIKLSQTSNLGDINLNGTNTTNLDNPLSANSLTTDGGVTNLNAGEIVTTGNQNYNNPVTLGSNANLQGATINFNASFDSPNQSNLTVGATNIKLSQTSNLGDINLNSTNTTNLDNPLSANSLTTDGGVTNLNAEEIVTTGNQNYNNPVELGKDTSLTGANISLQDVTTIQGNQPANLTIQATGGDVTAGNLNSLGAIDINGSNNLNTGNISGQKVTLDGATIVAEEIETNAGNGNDGGVTLTSAGDIQVTSIKTQGDSGNVLISTDNFFRATGESAGLSIGTDGGFVRIEHGGKGEIPFIVGDSGENGTKAAIATNLTTIQGGSFLYNYTQDNISIVPGVDQPPPPPSEPTLNNEEAIETIISPPSQNPPVVTQPISLSNPFQGVKQPVTTISQARDIIQNIERATGVKPAIVYVSFNPPGVETQENFAQREGQLTQEYTQYQGIASKTSLLRGGEAVDQDELQLVLVTQKGEPIFISVPDATRKKVLEEASKLYKSVSNLEDNYKVPAARLYDWLIRPLTPHLEEREINNLLFVMPLGLRLTPLATLYDAQNSQYVVEKYSVGLSPSLSLTNTTYQSVKNSPVLALGSSTFTAEQQQNALPAVEIEVPLIASKIRSGEFVIDKQFTLENLLKARQENPYPIIHLSTHADFQPGDLSNSYIQLYNRKIYLNDLPGLKLSNPPVELLVISACRSAYGDENVELGFGGLAAQAGVKTVLASLWYVGDTGTLALMSQFYENLGTAPIKAEALREAQVAMLKGQVRKQGAQIITTKTNIDLPENLGQFEEDLSHPFYWASFTIIGSPW
jgi:filamentous hemagglutinin family protein